MAFGEPVRPGLFALPLRVDDDGETDGLLVRRSSICGVCKHEKCVTDQSAGVLRVCPEGVNYVRPTRTALIRGIFVEGFEPPVHGMRQAVKKFKTNRRNASRLVRAAELGELITGLQALAADRQLSAEEVNEAAVRAEIPAVSAEGWVRKLVAENAGSLSSTLIHDLLQLVATIFQNSDYILDARYGGTTTALQRNVPSQRPLQVAEATKVWKKEKAVFFTAELLKNRLEAAFELAKGGEPIADRWSMLSPHQMFTKFIRIYEALGEDEGIELRVTGQSVAKCFAPERKFAFPFSAVLDNALKYAPRRSTVTVDFFEDVDEVVVSVRSSGPRIREHERELIFAPRYRGADATASGVAGSGIGLWQARRALEGWGAISVSQGVSPDGDGRFPTSFELRLARDYRRKPVR